MAVICAYASTYTHTHVRLKASGRPGAEGKETALASRKPLAPDDKNGNKALRRNASPRRINRDVMNVKGGCETVINHHVTSIDKGGKAVINRDIKRDALTTARRWLRRTRESKIRLRQQRKRRPAAHPKDCWPTSSAAILQR